MSKPEQSGKIARPNVACELNAAGVAAARVGPSGQLEAMHTRSLAAGALVPSLTAQNIVDAGAVREAIRDTVLAAAGRTHEVTAVLPDTAARVVLLDFDTLPTRASEADAAVRFRLRKGLPFDTEEAVISYHVQRGESEVRVVAAVMQAAVRDEYELAFRDAGCAPGVVLPSTLAALGLVDASEPCLLVKVDATATSVAIVNEGHLLLLRTLDGAEAGKMTPAQLADDVYPSLVYFQDTFGTSVKRILLAGAGNLRELAPALAAQAEAPVEELIGASLVNAGGRADFAGALGALY